jgi:acyl-CoA synthetase (NDP forming)
MDFSCKGETMKDFFYPKNIAVVGVSGVPGNLGKLIVQNLEAFGFTGRWHAVGHIPGQVCGQPIHESVLDIPEEIDLNPVMVMDQGQGAVPVDCKIFLNKKAKTEGQDKTNE